jgi:cephalosporin hydroxylase
VSPDIDDLAAIDGLISTVEGRFLAELAAQVPADQSIVEIGSFKGQSGCYLARGSKAGSSVKVHCVDLWDIGGQRHGESAGYADPSTFAAFQSQIGAARVKSMIVAHKIASTEIAAQWHGPLVGLLFLDGDHRYEPTAADLAAWSPLLGAGAVVAFHDYCERFPGVVRAADEWLATVSPVDVVDCERIRAVRLS